MSEQRIDTGAEAATSAEADPGEGQGAAGPGGHADPLDPDELRTAGHDADMPQPTADRSTATGVAGGAGTEGATGLRETQARAESGGPDLTGRQPAADGLARASSAAGTSEAGTSPAGDAPARAETGEVSAAPSPERRAEDPGSMASEFGDRADSAPEDDVARPSI